MKDNSIIGQKPAQLPGTTFSAPGVRRIGAINGLGVWTLYLKEVRRFFKVIGQTVLAPIVTTTLFMAIFTIAFDGKSRMVGDISFALFLAPGLVMMAILQNAFANTTSSLMTAKMQGNIVDLIMAPIGPGEMTLAFTLAAITRGILVGIAVMTVLCFFADIRLLHIEAVVYFGLSGAMMLALLGILVGIWAAKWEQSANITNFVVVPLSFLSGTFYSIDRLPGIWHDLSQLNPFFYLIDGFRYGVTGQTDGNLVIGVIYCGLLNMLLWLACYYLLRTGYKLRP